MNEELDNRQKNYVLMRSIRDYGMGILFLSIGIVFFFAKKILGNEVVEDPILKYAVLILFTIYGLFRIYRGYAKQYFDKND
jgi:hypothetical protein